MDEFSEDDKLSVTRARKVQKFLSQPFVVAETFTNTIGKYVQLAETIRGLNGIVNGNYHHLPEQAFYMVGSIEEAVEAAETMNKRRRDWQVATIHVDSVSAEGEVLSGDASKVFAPARMGETGIAPRRSRKRRKRWKVCPSIPTLRVLTRISRRRVRAARRHRNSRVNGRPA